VKVVLRTGGLVAALGILIACCGPLFGAFTIGEVGMHAPIRFSEDITTNGLLFVGLIVCSQFAVFGAFGIGLRAFLVRTGTPKMRFGHVLQMRGLCWFLDLPEGDVNHANSTMAKQPKINHAKGFWE